MAVSINIVFLAQQASRLISNWVTQNRTHGPANELLTINSQTLSYDADGNLAQDTLYNYSYDEENRLTQVQRLSDSAVVGRYFYDALGRRVISITTPAGVSATNVFYYDYSRLIEEQNGAGASQATYVYGNYVDEVVTMERGGQTYYFHQNALWSPHALTDAGGNAVERYTYDVYGGVIVMDGSYNPLALNAWGTPHSAVGNPYLFTGRELDEETGLYFYRARYYDGLKGRFLERDPVDYEDGLNLYEYVHGRPTMFDDPSGMVVEVCCDQVAGGALAIIGAIGGGAVGGIPGAVRGGFLGTRPQHCWVNVRCKGVLTLSTELQAAVVPVPAIGWRPFGTGAIGRPSLLLRAGANCTPCSSAACENCNAETTCLRRAQAAYPVGAYGFPAPNSNTYASVVAASCCDKKFKPPAPGIPPLPGGRFAPGWGGTPPVPGSFTRIF